MADKAKPAGISASRKVTDDDDVEGHRHSASRATEGITNRRRDGSPDGISASRKVTDDDDVEGHRHSASRATEGITNRRRDGSPDGITTSRKITEDDDVEGHSMLLNPGLARQIAQARERDVQKSLKRHELEHDARSAKKGDH